MVQTAIAEGEDAIEALHTELAEYNEAGCTVNQHGEPIMAIFGTAYDCDGEPMSGVVIQLDAKDGSGFWAVLTDDHGFYYFPELLPGKDYDLIYEPMEGLITTVSLNKEETGGCDGLTKDLPFCVTPG